MSDYPITLILGGARSGKSVLAEQLAEQMAEQSGKSLYYIATAEGHDDEMIKRIKIHQGRRNNQWKTLEEPLNIAQLILETAQSDRVLLIDCLTLWLSNIMCAEGDAMSYINPLTRCLERARGPVILVSNEVGLGIVPVNKLARDFQDEAGRMNKAVAQVATDVLFMVAGLPMCLKKDGFVTYTP